MIALVARELLNGGQPYVSIFQEKPLGAAMVFAAAFQILGQSIWTIRLIGSLSVVATTLLLREIALTTGASQLAAVTAALLYAWHAIELGGMASNIEILLAPFTIGAVWLGLRQWDTIRYAGQCKTIALAGLMIGISIWFKYMPALPGCVLFAFLVGYRLWRGFVTWPGATVLAFIYLSTCLLPTVLTAAYYA